MENPLTWLEHLPEDVAAGVKKEFARIRIDAKLDALNMLLSVNDAAHLTITASIQSQITDLKSQLVALNGTA